MNLPANENIQTVVAEAATAARADQTERLAQVDDLPPGCDAQIRRAFNIALRHTGIYVAYHDRSLTKVWTRNILAPLVPKKKGGGLPPAQLERIEAAQRHVLETGESGRIEVSMPHEDGVRWFDIWLDADLDDDGTIQGIVSTWIEVTEQKRREQTLKTLLREVSHRSKNLLAIIQGIASQTGRYSSDIGDFLTRFRGRLQSLSSSQDLVTSSNWRGARLRELIEGQMERYGADPSRSLRFEGVDPFLNPNAALHIGLAVHELVVNSMSYGALSQSDAVVDVTAGLADLDANPPALWLRWNERFPSCSGPEQKRFGSVALERVVPAALDGMATFEISDDRVEYHLVVPAGNFAAD